MKRADEILAMGRVDAGLAADRRIDLRQQARGNLHETNTAPRHGGSEARKVADYAPAERDHQIAAFDACCENRIANLLQRRIGLGCFSGRDRDHGRS